MKLYRYSCMSYSTIIDSDIDLYGSTGPLLKCQEFEVLSTTPKGFWFANGFGKSWVNNYSRKRFAYPTKLEALEGFRQKKISHIRHCQNKLDDVQKALDLTEAEIKRLNK